MTNEAADLQVLSNYLGKWDIVGMSNDGPSAMGQVTGKWVLDSRFVQRSGFVKTADGSNDFEILSLITFDQERKKYRLWSFFSHGMATVTEATWDAATNTMTEIRQYGDITQTATSHFARDGIEEWTLVNTDEANNVVSEMHGTNTRRDS